MKRTLLLIVASLLPCSLGLAAPTQAHSHRPGDLARDRLQGMESLLSPSNTVTLAKSGQAGVPLSAGQTKAVLARLVELVSDDALYLEVAGYDRDGASDSLIVGELGRTITISIRRDKPDLTIMRWDGNRVVNANYLPVLPKVVRLLQAIYPNDHRLNSFHPLPLPIVPKAKGIPASALTRIATLTPGQTRADVLRLFTTEGGVSTTYWNHYVYKDYGLTTLDRKDGLAVVPGGLVKVNVDFAPRDADVVWLHGRGFWLHQGDYHAPPTLDRFAERPDDVILRVSAPYVEQEVYD